MSNDVFISYRRCDAEIARNACNVFESRGLRCWIDADEIRPSELWDETIVRAISQSRLLVLIVSQGSTKSPKQQKRELSIAEKHSVPVVPIFVIEPRTCTSFDYLLGNTHYIDASKSDLMDRLEYAASELRRLISSQKVAEQKARHSPAQASPSPPAAPHSLNGSKMGQEKNCGLDIAILYKHNVPEDERLLELLRNRLSARGHFVFVDKELEVGADWRRVIRQKVENADGIIPLLSVFSVGSEMLEEEIAIASRRQKTVGGTPLILPVRVNYEGALPPGLAQHLQRLQYLLWRSPADDEVLVAALVDALENPKPVPLALAQQREMPVGAVPLTSPFYVVRDCDRSFQSGIERCDSIVLVKGPRQVGKTSLIARGLQLAREKQRRVAITDLQALNDSDFKDLRAFYTALAAHLAEQLELEASLDALWDERRAANVNFERYMRREVLKAGLPPLAWALDEVDRLFAHSFGSEVFGLFRSWHNKRALDPSSEWDRFTLVIGYATEASLFIRDVNMSPFNVGTQLTLADFSLHEVQELNDRYGSPLQGIEQIQQLMDRVGGQPFLIRRSLYALSVESIPLSNLLTQAATDQGVFGDHLRRFYVSLHRDTQLEKAVREFILDGSPLLTEDLHRLRSAGIVVGDSAQDAEVRCGIYRDYLRSKLV